LKSKKDHDGRPFLPLAFSRKNYQRKLQYYFSQEEVDRFKREYATLRELSTKANIASGVMRKRVLGRAVTPILPYDELHAYVYRRSDL
jgi:hypothetical protein